MKLTHEKFNTGKTFTYIHGWGYSKGKTVFYVNTEEYEPWQKQ